MFQDEALDENATVLTPGPTRPLSNRERAVLQLVARGCVTPEIALELDISAETVKSHVHNAMTKLGARTRAHAVALCAAQGQIALVAEAFNPPSEEASSEAFASLLA